MPFPRVTSYPNTIHPDTQDVETKFREQIRDILDLDPFVRDQAIFDELRRLKKQVAALKA